MIKDEPKGGSENVGQAEILSQARWSVNGFVCLAGLGPALGVCQAHLLREHAQ